jgi:peptide/nickel transport system permease protein
MAIASVPERPKATARLSIKPAALIPGLVLLLLIVLATLAPLIAPFSPNANDLAAGYQLPSATHLLGTDELGRDLLSRLMYGGRISLTGVAEALAVYLVLGLIFGIIAGYVGGAIEAIVVWIADLSFALPQIIVILALLAVFSNNTAAAMLALGILGAPGLAVFVRGATKTVRHELYISAARVSGLRTAQILFRHILPRIAGPIIVQVTLFAGIALLFQTGMDFLGLGTQPPTASWGAMVAEGSTYLGQDIWMVMPAGLVIVIVIVSFALLGDAIQDRRSDAQSGASRSLPQSHSVAAGSAAAEATTMVSSPTSVLEVRHLSASTSVGAIPIVQDVSFSLEPGQCLGIVGESGCGKTMTALAVIGLLPEGVVSTGGEVRFQGKDLLDPAGTGYRNVRGSGIGMISQEPIASLDPSFTVGSHIAEVVRRHSGISRRAARERTMELLRQVRLPDPEAVARKYPHELSGGMAQRVLIAAALAGEPDILIADEPTTALDVTVQAEILQLLRELREETGVAMILVSHDWGVIADSCDAAIVMYAGQVVEEAPIEAVFAAPRHPYSYALMESNPHLALPGEPLPSLPGSVPNVGSWPIGCHFADRCPFATVACSAQPIPLSIVGEDHIARCIHTDKVPIPEEAVA